jgi:hypothetical protein
LSDQQNGRLENKKPAVFMGRVDACGLVAHASHICFCKPPCPEWQVGVGVNPAPDDGLILPQLVGSCQTVAMPFGTVQHGGTRITLDQSNVLVPFTE